MAEFLQLYNGQAFAAAELPRLPLDDLRSLVIDEVADGARLAALFARPTAGVMQLVAVLARAEVGSLVATSAEVGDRYPALTPECAQAHCFEREIAEQWGIQPAGHPWLKPLRFQPPRRPAAAADNAPHAICGTADFFAMQGEEVHEVAVGPVHAGIIEPGHFRFQCHGETVYHLEISLGYQHRGVERAMVAGPGKRVIHYVETLAGDTSVGHATAYCRIVEALAKIRVPARAQLIRGLALELERIANHIGDLGAMAGDVGFLPTQSYCGRIRGDVLNLTALLCGNRFGRGLVRPGGVAFDVDAKIVAQLQERLDIVLHDATVAIELMFDAPSVMARFERVGMVPAEVCVQLGLVGVAARACGLNRDVRRDFPYGIYRFAQIPVSTHDSGDVFARACIRWLEIRRSLEFLREQLQSLPDGPIAGEAAPPAAGRMAVSLVEGWRGEICHIAATDDGGKLEFYKVIDPSFHNWSGLAYAVRNQQISDFPLCNKSFNLSYCGHDL